MMYSFVRNATFVGARGHFEKCNCKKCEGCFLFREATSRTGRNRGKVRGEHEREIKMCLVQLYFIRRAQNFYFRCSLTLAARSFIN